MKRPGKHYFGFALFFESFLNSNNICQTLQRMQHCALQTHDREFCILINWLIYNSAVIIFFICLKRWKSAYCQHVKVFSKIGAASFTCSDLEPLIIASSSNSSCQPSLPTLKIIGSIPRLRAATWVLNRVRMLGFKTGSRFFCRRPVSYLSKDLFVFQRYINQAINIGNIFCAY